MATRFYMRSIITAGDNRTAGINQADDETHLDGLVDGWAATCLASTTRGTSLNTAGGGTQAGPVNGIEAGRDAGEGFIWLTQPLDADVTISGTITFNVWASESNMSANVAINCLIDVLDPQMAVVNQIIKTTRTTEVAVTTRAVNNFTGTPTSTLVKKGSRLRIRWFADDAGTMGSGFTFNTSYAGTTAAADGDTYVEFTENFGVLSTEPSGTQLFLTDTAGPAVGSNVEKEMWTSRGAGVASLAMATAAGWHTTPRGLQWTDGTTAYEWYSKPLQAFTLSGLVRCNLRAKTTLAQTNGIGVELAVVDGDGSNASVFCFNAFIDTTAPGGGTGTGTHGAAASLDTVERQVRGWLAGEDKAVADGQRLRVRVYATDQALGPMISGQTTTFYYAGTSGGASGDSWIQLGQSVSEYVVATAAKQVPNRQARQLAYR